MPNGDPQDGGLTNREQEVAEAYASGQSYKEIARTLGVSPTTVRTHLRTVYSKLGVTSKIQLAQFLGGSPPPEDVGEGTASVAELALELDDAVRRERSLAKVLRIISQQGGDLEAVIDEVLDHALEICEAEFGILFEYHGDFMVSEMRSRGISPAFDAWLKEVGTFRVEPGTGVGRAAEQLKPVSIADIRAGGVYESGSPLRVATMDFGKARSLAAIPMTSGDRLIGVFTVYRTRVHPFNERALELVQLFADQAAIAIENIRQFREIQARLDRAQANREILEVIRTNRDDEQPVFQAIARNAVELCEAQFCMMWRYDGTLAHYCASYGFTEEFMTQYLVDYPAPPESAGIVYQVVRHRRTFHLPNAQAETYTDAEVATQHGYQYMLGVPIDTDEGMWGVIVLAWPTGKSPGDEQVELLETYAAQAVIAINNVRQFRELQSRLEHAQATREILQVISNSRDDEVPVFDAILENACKLCDAPLAYLSMATEDRTEVVSPARLGAFAKFGETLDNLRVPLVNSPLALARAINECRVFREDDIADSPIYTGGDPNRVSMVEDEGARSLLVVPLIRNGEGIGSITLYRREVVPFSDDDVALVESFAAQAVIAIENVRQFRELQVRLERQSATREILQAINASRDDSAPVFDVILESARRLCDAPTAALVLGRKGDTHQIIAAHHGAVQNTVDVYRDGAYPMDPKVSFGARAILEKRTVHLHDMRDTDEYRAGILGVRSLVDNQGIRTNLLVPLVAGDAGIGCLVLFRNEVRPYTEDQIALVETFAEQAAIAIENVRQFRELQARLDRERGTSEILQLLSQSREDEVPVFDLILHKAAELCGADAAALSFGREGESHQRLAAAREVHEITQQHYRDGNVGMNPETSFAARAIVAGVPVHVEDFAESEGYKTGDVAMRSLVDDTGMRTSLFVPLLSKKQGIGALILFRREVRPYTADEISLVETFATQAVLAVENVEQFRALESLNAELEQRVDTQVTEIERMGRFRRFLSPAVADALVNSGDESVLASHRALIATLFCDIRGFTAFCEVAEPEETIEVLQAYHEEMGKLISTHGGGVDKRMGDGIMVIFNDPLPCEDPAGDAVRLAVAMRERMVELCKGWKRLGHRLGFGVGISLGYATIGMVGSEGRYDYTASGTAVNMAARLCDRAEDGEILLSPRAYTAVEDEMSAESSGEIDLKGLREPVEVFRLSGQ